MNVFGDALPGSEYTYIFGQHPAACMKKHHSLTAIQTFLWSSYDRLCIWTIWLFYCLHQFRYRNNRSQPEETMHMIFHTIYDDGFAASFIY